MRISIKTKVCIAFIFVSTVAFIMSGILIYREFWHTLQEKNTQEIINVMHEQQESFDAIMMSLQSTKTYLSINQSISKFLKSSNAKDLELIQNIAYFSDTYSHLYNTALNTQLKDYQTSFYINKNLPIADLVTSGTESIFDSPGKYIYTTQGIEEASWFQEALRKRGEFHLFKLNEESSYLYVSQMIFENMRMNNMDSFIGLNLIGINMPALLSDMQRIGFKYNALIAMIDNEGALLSKSADKIDDAQILGLHNTYGGSIENIRYKDYYVNEVRSDVGIHFISFIPLKDIQVNAERFRRTVTIYFICVMMLFIILSILLSRYLTDPIRSLTEAVGSSRSGNVGALHLEIKNNDEIGDLYAAFNAYDSKIECLMQNLQENAHRISELKLRLFQTRINHHMLYNTLDSISWIAISNHQTKIVEMNSRLASLLRYLTRGVDFMASLEDEVDCVDNYIQIQQLRYRSPIVFQCSLKPEMKEIRIPKCTLQPLVENAIVHGIDNWTEQLTICLSAYRLENLIQIKLEDNGCGCDVDFINRMLQDGQAKILNERKSIGIENVNERLKLTYGTDYSMRYFLNQNGGVTVCISIPPVPANEV